MIIFLGDGRLGNQLFQYSFIQLFKSKNEKVVTTNFGDLIQLLRPRIGVYNYTINRPFRSLIKYARLLFQLLGTIKLVSSVRVIRSPIGRFSVESTEYIKVNGLLPITYIYPCFAQSESFVLDHGLSLDDVDDLHIREARAIINDIQFENDANKYAFVHVRRGDYLNWSVLGMNPTLPLSYYKKCMNHILEIDKAVKFLILADDIEYVMDNFSDYPNAYISKEPQETDLCLMALCEYGVLSNSSFSWWGGYMMKNRIKLFAPKYWLGWASKIEYQRGGAPSFAEAVEVEAP